jgi:hypothetical protein
VSFVDDLAAFRGISREEAEKQVKEDELLELIADTESKMVHGKPLPALTAEAPLFSATAVAPRPEVSDAVLKSLNEFGQRLIDQGENAKFRTRPKLEGLAGDELVEATEVLMTHEGLFPAEAVEAADALGKAVAKGFMEEMNRPSVLRQILVVTPLDPAKTGKRTIIAENGVLLSPPRMSTPEEDYDQLVEDTERKMTAPDPERQRVIRETMDRVPLSKLTVMQEFGFPTLSPEKEQDK